MKLLNYLAASAVAAVSMALPALAKVDPGTVKLLQTLQEYGVTIHYNPSDCNRTFQGSYNTSKVMKLCYSGSADANDHNTVRHEAFHYLQHCANERRGGTGLRPLAINPHERQQFVSKALNRSSITTITSSYPARAHQIELEAFAAAEVYSATDLITYIRSWCMK